METFQFHNSKDNLKARNKCFLLKVGCLIISTVVLCDLLASNSYWCVTFMPITSVTSGDEARICGQFLITEHLMDVGKNNWNWIRHWLKIKCFIKVMTFPITIATLEIVYWDKWCSQIETSGNQKHSGRLWNTGKRFAIFNVNYPTQWTYLFYKWLSQY